jgi:GH15 family glucan-1,4-alpha-glucosidase
MSAMRIEDHGVIGDLHTLALVALDGTIDFFCTPRFDSPSVFASLLDAERGGLFRIAPVLSQPRHHQRYLPDSNVLLTRFASGEGLAELSDFMTPGPEAVRRHQVFRRIKAISGELRYRMECRPRFGYGTCSHRVEVQDRGVVFVPEKKELAALRLRASIPLSMHGGDAVAEFALAPGESAYFALEAAEPACGDLSREEVTDAFKRTVNYWRHWIGQCTYVGRWREVVNRSALVLKLLTSQTEGSMIAAGTFGLPGGPSGERNWDYRYTWIRDTAFAMAALMRLGFWDEAEAFFHWIDARCNALDGSSAPLQPLYRVDGSRELSELSLDHFAGYEGSRPVRVGNAAVDQLQLDLYGELLQALDFGDRFHTPIHHDLWTELRAIVSWVGEHWNQPDDGIWETRAGRLHFLHSRALCWVALDRGLQIAVRRSFPAPLERWRAARDAIYEEVMGPFFDPAEGCFRQHRDGDAIDASALLLPLVGFVSPTDPRWLSTLRAIERHLVRDSFVYRYDLSQFADGLRGVEGTFTVCTFWYVECLARSGDLRQARLVFEKALGQANHLGLFAEQFGPSGEQRGNFPQALSHLALVSAALDLNERLDRSPEPDM